MRKILYTTTLISGFCFSQFTCYLPTGEKCTAEQSKGRNLSEVMLNFDKYERMYFEFPKKTTDFVVFKSLSKIPVFLLSTKNDYTKEEVQKNVEEIDFTYYFGQYNSGLKMNLDKLIEEKTGTDIFVTDSMDSPNESKEMNIKGKKLRYMTYSKYGLKLWFEDSILVGYEQL
ncbi:hypothetical protein [Kaistella antarctica]|uniref:Uncharacterized protein n=2 Tax=Kaistella antarctica TaxID=266748 RepID=A0A3S4UMZ8_9FLAO|nr:hypothetical protein [Kaistella antarctica]SEV81582.1 hypothetical protein SAMN05421765_0267 [Kaistella antarctica]VEI00374.1 Uncharacterised protein [Kaistella antarctica]